MDNLEIISQSRWTWNWVNLCGNNSSLNPINPDTNDLSLCFQQLCLQVNYKLIYLLIF